MGQAVALVHAGRDQPLQSRVELELLPAASSPAASCQLKHLFLVDEIQIPELYKTLSHR